MSKITNFIKQKRTFIIVVAVLFICSIAIAVGVYTQVTHEDPQNKKEEKENASYEDLKNNFQKIFTNTINKEETAALNVDY